MTQLEILGPDTWEEFINSEKSVLMLGKTDCPACESWTKELSNAIDAGEIPSNYRYGKLIINQKGLLDFKKSNKWLADIDILPFNVIYNNGEALKKYGGGGIDRLQTRLSRL